MSLINTEIKPFKATAFQKGKFIDVARQSGDYFRRKYVGRGAAFGAAGR